VQADHATAPDVAAGVDPAVADELCGERLRADVLHLAGDLDLLGLLRLLDLAGDPGVAPRATAWAGGAARALSPLRSLGSGLRCGQPAHEVVAGVGDEHVAPRLIDRHAEGPEQLRTSPRPAVAAERAVRAGGAVAGDRRDRPARRQLADLVVVGVGDVDVARAVDRDPFWKVELGGGRGRPVAARRRRARARVAVASDRRDRPARGQLADLVVVGIGDVDVARAVDRDPGWKVELGGGRGRAVPA